ncbi:MAG: glycoside hydrolase family 9 protein [Terriglobia bacterium]
MQLSFGGLSAERRRRASPLKPVMLIPLVFFLVAIALSPFLLHRALANRGDTSISSIKVDQVGYPTSGRKIAMVSAPASSFAIKRASDNATVFQDKLSAGAADANSGDTLEAADFSAFHAPGTYYLEIPGAGQSWPFSVGADVYSRTFYLAMRAFYGQRCGTAVDLGPEFSGYKHAACHLQGSFHASSGKAGPRDNIGGWHDAGDYGRYIVNSGISTATLLWAWELFRAKLDRVKLNIPESGNGTPDFLNEVRWNLEWMLKMQDDDGGVWHKQTSEQFPGFVMPEDDPLPSLVIGTGSAPYKSTCATADLAAVAAIAARAYQTYDPDFAAKNLQAAREAWAWTERYPNVTFRNPPGISTGEYGDTECGDERLWAAAELWRTTGESSYNKYFLDNYAKYLPDLRAPKAESWKEVAPMGLWAYALAPRPGGNAQARAAIRQGAVSAAHAIVDRTRRNAYRVSLIATDYSWGSNGLAADYGVQLLVTNALSPDPAFVEVAVDDLHYLLGRNTFSLSWVTQVGANPYRHPHHRPSGADKNPEPWPGMLSGGPNAARQDAILQGLPSGLPPAKVYSDNQESYASNEICINWQSMLVFLLAGVKQ